MKKYIYIMMGIVLTMSILLLGYGVYLNYASDKNINRQLLNLQKQQVKGIKAEVREIHDVRVYRSIRLETKQAVDAVSRNTGIVSKVYVREKQQVEMGEPILAIQNPEIALQISKGNANIAKNRAARERYASSMERYGKLVEMGAASKENYEEARANYLSATADEDALLAEQEIYRLQQENLIVRAPISGEIISFYVNEGEFVRPDTQVAMIANFERLTFEEEITDEEAQRIKRAGQKWTAVFSEGDLEGLRQGNLQDQGKLENAVFSMHVLSYDPPLEARGDIRKVVWQIDNHEGLLEPKLYQNIRFEAANTHQAIIVPKEALDAYAGDTLFVWKDGKLEKRKVSIGVKNEKIVEILDGVEVGEVVIVSSQNGLTDGMEAELEILQEAS